MQSSTDLAQRAKPSSARNLSIRSGFLLAALLLIFMGITLTAALQKSLTFDEPLHLYAGYSYLEWGDYRVNPEHPPLAKVIAALPLFALGVSPAHITRTQRDSVQRNDDYGWVLADQWIFANRQIEDVLLYPKLMMVGLAGILGVFIFVWARNIYGAQSAFATLVLYCFDPNIIAHAANIHTDVPFTLFFFASTYFFWRTLNRVTWLNLFLTAVLFAFAAITKFSFVVIIPIWFVLGFIRALWPEPLTSRITLPQCVTGFWRKFGLCMVVLLITFIITYLVIWLAYGVRFDAVADQQGRMSIFRLVSKDVWLSAFATFNDHYCLLPEAWVYGLFSAFRAFKRPSYLLGQILDHGSWIYFPVAFAVKTPLATLAIIVMGLVVFFRRSTTRLPEFFLLVPIVAFFSAAAWSGLNIGLRHILPVYPFLFVWLGGVSAKIWLGTSRFGRCGLLLLLLWLVASSLKTYPNYMAFFNEMVGGPKNGSRILLDSNLDWGQELKGLKRWMDDRKIQKIRLAYFGSMDPWYYGINAVPAPGTIIFNWRGDKDDSPTSPYIAISATYLAGLYLRPNDPYLSFRSKTPVASIGNSILVFHTDQ